MSDRTLGTAERQAMLETVWARFCDWAEAADLVDLDKDEIRHGCLDSAMDFWIGAHAVQEALGIKPFLIPDPARIRELLLAPDAAA